MLYQYKTCIGELDRLDSSSELGLLAGRSTSGLMRFGISSNAWSELSQIQQGTAIGHSDTELAAVRNVLPISMLHELTTMSEVSLRSLELLRSEIGSISKFVSDLSADINDNPLRDLNRRLLRLREKRRKALASVASAPDLERTKRALHQLLTRTSHDQPNMDEEHQHLQRSLEKAFGRRESDTPVAIVEDDEDITHTSAEYIQFFTGCLLLYVPDRPYDPALKPMVERDRHYKRRSELEIKLQALQDFELVFSGQKSSLRSQLVEKKISELGAGPEVPMIFRPKTSELGQLQAEFNNIVTSIILRSPSPKRLLSIIPRESAKIQEVELLRMNISQAVSRLNNGFQAYEDITKPLVGFLQGLDVGLALSLLAGSQQDPRNESMRYMCEMTPFLGAVPQGLARTTVVDLKLYRLQKFDPRLHFLNCTGMARCASKNMGEPLVRTMLQTFDSFYQEWKDQLRQDQRDNAAKSSLYRYRGGEEESDQADEQDFHNLFPDYDRPHKEETASQGPSYNARDQAQRLAGVQREIFGSAKNASERLLDLLQDSSEAIAHLWTDTSGNSKCQIPSENLFSSLVLSLDQHKDQLLGQAELGKHYNFYTDANLSEAQKLVALVQQTQTRFVDLQEAWPEHATLADVLRTSSELLALRHTEPIAKILTKVEQLHGYIHEWQVVASKQYTAATLYDQLTDLLVSWRRLELSTWARLLDMEDHKCNQDAESWWFVAYEVIIAAPLSMIEAEQDLQTHVEQLFSTLGDFMGTTSIGQYAHRLAMIDCFRIHLEIIAENIPLIGVVHSAISNFLSYYARFQYSIKQHLHKGRQKLEKDIKEILLLASWKDTNINALKDSAKRFHHKLFKLIRKYRSLLTESAETFINQAFSKETDSTATLRQNGDAPKVKEVDPRAIETCKSHFEIWNSKPERFRAPTSTAQRMFQMGQLPLAAIDTVLYLDGFGADLIDSIKTLQKETLSKATTANAEAIKHLKARKRKLYAETLKALRHMGFRSNLSADALNKQSSLSVILANTPALVAYNNTEISSAEFHFHQVLRMFPEIKERSRNHSEDLNHTEVNRSIGYLESIISVILEQRSVLATTLIDLRELDKMADMMQNLWAPGSYTLKRQDLEAQYAVKEVQHALRWLPAIIETGSVIIQKHGKMGEINHSNILADLRGWKDKMVTANTAFDQLPALPSNISSSQHEQLQQDALGLLKNFNSELLQMIERSPGLSFVLKQIVKWARAEVVSNDLHINGERPTSLIDLDDSITRALSSILVAMQRMQDASATIPASDEDATWLFRADSSLAASLKSLHAGKISELLQEAMGQLQYLNSANEGNLTAPGALIALALPIVEQFRIIVKASFNRYAELHRPLCKLSDHLAHSFLQVVQDGFCSPIEDSATEAGKTEKLEGGTGLGEGEGAEDISKDIQDDEDLSELAQGMEKNQDKEDIEDQENAVNLDHDELEGEMGDVSDKGEDDGSPSEGEENDIDEETGDVDNLDPSAVDEKLWDGKSGETDKEKEGEKGKGKVENDGQVVDDSTKERENAQVQEEEKEKDDDVSQNGAEESEEVAREEAEKIDPRSQEGQNLDLPEEMDLDNIDGTDADSASGDSDMDGMSDFEQAGLDEKERDDLSDSSQDGESEENAKTKSDALDQPENNVQDDDDVSVDGAQDAASPADTDPDEEQPADDPGLLHDRTDNQNVDNENATQSDAMGSGQDLEQTDAVNPRTENNAQGKDGAHRDGTNTDESQAAVEEGQLGGLDMTKDGPTDDNSNKNRGSQAFKKLGDALEKWHRQNRQIQEAPEEEASAPRRSDVDMASQEFEHLRNEETEADTQALGAASDDQARALDKEAMDAEMHDEAQDFPREETDEEHVAKQDDSMRKDNSILKETDQQHEQGKAGAFVASKNGRKQASDQPDTMPFEREEDIDHLDHLDKDFSATHLQSDFDAPPRSAEDARRLWSHYEALTRDLALSLTEQLRLILAPTLATKMRGDYRTGKRLNIKRIIPYIASQYKRDKIWMRRSIPSKRNYQIMLAVDDSKSMDESGSGQLAFETLALVSKSLSMLEVGEICVVGFGNVVRVAHDFGKPFSSDAGAQIIQQFGFQQKKTNVRKLIADSISLFREARRKTFNSGTDLWQLELIISDGVCEDHETIRRLVRQAQQEQIMIVFVIVDALLKEESIMDMSQAVFEPDSAGETKLKIKRYLDGFPFAYYLVVGDVRELPGVLAQALRQWFSEVAGSGKNRHC